MTIGDLASERQKLAAYKDVREQRPNRKTYEVIGKLHMACTQVRFAIAVYEKETEEGESTRERLEAARQIITEVLGEIP